MLVIASPSTVEVTANELHKHIQAWRREHLEVQDVAVALEMALAERWPYVPPADVCLQAELNSLAFERTKEVKAAAQNTDDWVDTHAQGDLFNPLPFSVPKLMLKDGKPAYYYEMTVVEMEEYLAASASSTEAQANEFQRVADDKRAKADRIRKSLEQVRKVIALAKQNGIEPNELFCDKAG